METRRSGRLPGERGDEDHERAGEQQGHRVFRTEQLPDREDDRESKGVHTDIFRAVVDDEFVIEAFQVGRRRIEESPGEKGFRLKNVGVFVVDRSAPRRTKTITHPMRRTDRTPRMSRKALVPHRQGRQLEAEIRTPSKPMRRNRRGQKKPQFPKHRRRLGRRDSPWTIRLWFM